MLPFFIVLFLVLILVLVYLSQQDLHALAGKQLSKKYKRLGLTSHFFQSDNDTQVHYWKGGTGTPLLLLHGFGPAAKFQWDPQIKAFSKEYELIIPDLIYFGESHSSSGAYSIDFQAASIQKLVEHLNIDQLSIVCISYGGLVGITLADLLKDKVSKLVICGSPIRYFTEEDISNTLERHQVPTIEELLVPAEQEGLRKLINVAFHRPPFIPNFVLKNIHAGMFRHQVEEKKQLLTHLFENREALKARDFDLSCKLLLLWGDHDKLIPNRIGEQLQKDFGDEQATYKTIAKTSHAPNAERPKIYNQIVLDFLNSKTH